MTRKRENVKLCLIVGEDLAKRFQPHLDATSEAIDMTQGPTAIFRRCRGMPCNIPCSNAFPRHHDARLHMGKCGLCQSLPQKHAPSGIPCRDDVVATPHPRSACPTFRSTCRLHFYLQLQLLMTWEADSDVVFCGSTSACVGSFHSFDILSHVHMIAITFVKGVLKSTSTATCPHPHNH